MCSNNTNYEEDTNVRIHKYFVTRLSLVDNRERSRFSGGVDSYLKSD